MNYFDLIQPQSTLILGFSGGPDSVYLLEKCLQLPQRPLIILAYVNHQLRGQESVAEAKLVQKIAKQKKLKLITKTLTNLKQKSGNLEENARQARYHFFQTVSKEYQAHWILTAHHLNDHIETVLFNFSRGISLKGLFGIPGVDRQRQLLRPLITTPKSTILNYLDNQQIPYHQDSSNFDTQYSRNLIRHEIIPSFQKINPSFLKTFHNSLTQLQEFAAFIDQAEQSWLNEHFLQQRFELDQFLSLPLFVQKQLLQKIYFQLHQKSLTIHQVSAIIKVLHQQKSNRQKEFGPGHQLKIQKNPLTQKREVVIKTKLD